MPLSKFNLASLCELEGNEARRITAMEGARGFAVALVFFVHYRAAFAGWAQTHVATDSLSQLLWTIGHSGVDLFFVLSGYLIYGAAIKPSLRYGRFMKRRVQRIYPTFLVVFALYLALSFVFPSQSKLPADAFGAIVYIVQNLLLLPGIFPVEAIITVAWSLSYEFFFYLTLPVIVLVFRLHRLRPAARALFWLAVAAAFVTSWFVLQPQASRMLMFVAGILVYEAIHSWSTPSSASQEWMALAFMVGAFASFPFLETVPRGELYRTIISAAAFGFFVFVLFRSEAGLRRTFSWSPMRWLGNMSYSYYLIHALVINAAAMVLLKIVPETFANAGVYWLLMPFIFAATFVVSTLLFALVEKPFSLVAHRNYPMPATAEAVAP